MNIATPGVYVKEISKFPPSVAAVETAIPAFIGYTEVAKKDGESLLNKPTRITSLLEYENHFGKAKNETGIQVSVGSDGSIVANGPSDSEKSPFIMYYMMQLYFANGGGPCYIVSVGEYSSTASSPVSVVLKDELSDGLKTLEKVDEPTLLLLPDATSIDSDPDSFYALYNDALSQCLKLQDRFTIIDTYTDDENADDTLRQKITSNLEKKYGAAYYPFLSTILDYAYNDEDVKVAGVSESLIDVLNKVRDAIDTAKLESTLTNLALTKKSIADAANNDAALPFKANAETELADVITQLESFASGLNELRDKTVEDFETESDALNDWVDSNIESQISSLKSSQYKLSQDDTKTKLNNTLTTVFSNTVLDVTLDGNDEYTSSEIVTNLEELKDGTQNQLSNLETEIIAAGATADKTLDLVKADDDEIYNKIKSAIGRIPINLPPSSAIAGVYASTDNARGVWKAPANVSLNYVVKPSVQITHEENGLLNIDATSGKSINAIRSFTGKGTLVWGARTLAGNDNEWRYVPVRRFFNFVEESVKKATEQFVFEPNDANTWVKVKAMIENFLTNQWREGALAGSKPEHAFYVNIGLGETMTAQDILEGKMIVEIGMAAVRPAEFIILKFSHKMQES